MKIGKTVKVVTSPQRNIRKANEARPDPRAIPVAIPKKKVKKPVEAEMDFKFSYRMSFGYAVKPKDLLILYATT